MAFEDARGGGSRTPKSAGPTFEHGPTATLTRTGQRLWTFLQAINAIDRLVSSIGTDADTTALRQRLVAAESNATTLQNEIDSMLRSARVEIMATQDEHARGQYERIVEQYKGVRAKFTASTKASHLAQRQYTPRHLSAREMEQQQQQQSSGRNGRRGAAGSGNDDDVEVRTNILIELGNIRPAEEAIAEERAAEALEIARDAAALNVIVRDVNTLVVDQGEQLNVAETSIDASLEGVQKGNQELVKAAQYQSGYRKKCFFVWGIIIAAVVTVIVVVVVKYTA